MSAAVEIRELTKRFGAFTAVDHISFSVERGEILGFLGPNGAGKSTTMKMVTGFLAPTSGAITVCGQNVATAPLATKSSIGYLPEGAPLYGDMTPLGLFRFVAEVRGIPAARRRAAIDDAIDKVQLAEVLHQPIETLSKGFKRRVGLAQAILHDPEVLILDEPTDGLDPNQKHEVRNLIRSMSRDKVIILSTHILEEVDAVCSRAIIIARGRIVADGRPEELQARSRWHNAVTLTLRGAGAAKAPEKIAAVDGVSSIERREAGDGAVSFVAFSAGGRPIATKIGEATRALGVEVDEMRVEQGHLDEVFRALTTGDEAAPRAAAARSPKPAQAPGGNGASPSAAMSAPAASPKSSAATTAPGGGRKVGGTKSKSNKGGRR